MPGPTDLPRDPCDSRQTLGLDTADGPPTLASPHRRRPDKIVPYGDRDTYTFAATHLLALGVALVVLRGRRLCSGPFPRPDAEPKSDKADSRKCVPVTACLITAPLPSAPVGYQMRHLRRRHPCRPF